MPLNPEELRKRRFGLLIARSAVLAVMIALVIFTVRTKLGGQWVPIVFGALVVTLIGLSALSTVNSVRAVMARNGPEPPTDASAATARRYLLARSITIAVVGVVLGIIGLQIPPIGSFAYAFIGLLVAASVTLFVVGNARITRRLSPPPSD